MSNDYSNIDLVINTEKKRFELQINNHTAFIEFALKNGDTIFLRDSQVPKELQGKGVGSALVEKVLNYIKGNGYVLAPICPFVKKYLIIHPEWQSILAVGYQL